MTTTEIIQQARDRSIAIDDGIARLIDKYPDLVAKDPVIARMVKLSTGHQSYLDRHSPAAPNLDTDRAFELQAS
jgi:hypothetical protein